MAKPKKISPPAQTALDKPKIWFAQWPLAGLIVLYLIFAAGYNAVTPAATADQHNPDENAHMQYVQTLASGHLPVFTDSQYGYENHQPPLFYTLCVPVALATHGMGGATETHAVRWVSILLGALLLVAVYRCVLTMFPQEPILALGTAAFAGLLPSNVALSASVTNDSLTTLVIVLALWLLINLIICLEADDASALRRQAVWLGIALGAGIWTKTLTLSVFLTVLVTLLLLARRGPVFARRTGQAGVISLGLGVLLGAPWLIRNTMLYGDPLAQHLLLVTLNTGANNTTMEVMVVVFHGVGQYFVKVAQWAFASFWGGFDSMRLFWDQNPRTPRPNFGQGLTTTYQCLLALCLVSVAGLALRWRQVGADDGGQQTALIVLPAQTVFTVVAFLNYNVHFFQAQGRYLYPAVLPLAFFFIFGWRGLLTRPGWFPLFVGLLTLGLAVLNIYTIFGLLLPRFSFGE